MLEKKSKPPISRGAFAGRMAVWFLATLVLFLVSLGFGIWGYMHFENMHLIDATLNASMILGGMGPVGELHTNSGKLFAAFFAVYSGFFLVVAGGLLLVPVFHRVLHMFHADTD